MNVVVVGAGMSGLLSALVALERGWNVTIIDRETQAGGLWSSRRVTLAGEDYRLDEGLRLPVKAGEPKWDDLLFANPEIGVEWLEFDGWTREGSIFRDRFSAETSCVDTRLLGEEANRRGIEAMAAALARTPSTDRRSYANDHDMIGSLYGTVFRDEVFEPVLRGLFRCSSKELAAGTHRSVIPKRLVMCDVDQMDPLSRAHPALAGYLGHSRHDALPKDKARAFVYPGSGAISDWTTGLTRYLEKRGATFRFGTGVKFLRNATGGALEVQVNNGADLDADLVVWTLPPVLLSLMGMDFGVKPIMPKFANLGIAHMKFSEPASHRVQYALNFQHDPGFFRAVFRDNIVGDGSNIVTLEQLDYGEAPKPGEAPPPADRDAWLAPALSDLRRSGAIEAGMTPVDVDRKLFPRYLPVITPEYKDMNEALISAVQRAFPSLLFVGRAAGGGLFLDEIIREVSTTLGRY